jgi:hypothetical protein
MATETDTAERSFSTRLKKILSRQPDGPSMVIDEYWYLGKPIDTGAVEKVFFQYGTYLELIGGDAPVEQPRVFTWTPRTA